MAVWMLEGSGTLCVNELAGNRFIPNEPGCPASMLRRRGRAASGAPPRRL